MTNTKKPALVRGDWILLAACTATMTLPDIGIWMRPAVTNTLMAAKGLSEEAAGAVTTAEVLGFSGAMLLCARLASGVSFRRLGLLGFALAVAMSIASIVSYGLALLMVVRVLTAIGFGTMATVAYAAASRVSDTGRAYGYLFSGGMLLSFVALLVLPQLQALFGVNYAFFGFLCFAAVLLPIMWLLPANHGFERQVHKGEEGSAEAKARWSRIVLLSVAFSAQAIPYQGVWSFLYVLAAERGLSEEVTGTLVSMATLAALFGSLSSATISRFIGRSRFVMGAVALAGLAIVALLVVREATIFSASACALMFVLFAFYPAVFSTAADIDPSGRGASFLQGLSMLVGGIGPLIAGVLLKDGNLGLMIGGTVVTCALSMVLLGYVYLQLARLPAMSPAASDASAG